MSSDTQSETLTTFGVRWRLRLVDIRPDDGTPPFRMARATTTDTRLIRDDPMFGMMMKMDPSEPEAAALRRFRLDIENFALRALYVARGEAWKR